ncbi:MAG: two-component regulator propeller domain-containing protein [Acidobacteriota bacterium]
MTRISPKQRPLTFLGPRPPRFRQTLTALGALLSLAPPLLADSPPSVPVPRTPEGVELEHLTIEDGLSHSTVWDVLQDRQGFLWFATNGLLQRYDGYKFRSFRHDPEDPGSVTSGKIMEIFEDRRGMLWLATRSQGIDRFDPATQRFTHFVPDPDDPASLPDGRVRAFHEDRSGALWIGSYAGLHRFEPATGSFIHYRHDPDNPDSISPSTVSAIFEDSHGDFWIGHGLGLDHFDRSAETFIHHHHDPEDPDSLSDGRVHTLFEDSSGELWIGAERLNRFDRQRNAFVRHTLAASDSIRVNTILEDGDGELWIGTFRDGIFRTDRAAPGQEADASGERFIHFRHDPEDRSGLGSNQTLALWQDRTGILWIAHRDGVDKYDRRRERFVKYRRGESELPPTADSAGSSPIRMGSSTPPTIPTTATA